MIDQPRHELLIPDYDREEVVDPGRFRRWNGDDYICLRKAFREESPKRAPRKWRKLWSTDTPHATGLDNWGTQVAVTAGPLQGNGLPTSPITFQPGGASGDTWMWDGTQWILFAPVQTVSGLAPIWVNNIDPLNPVVGIRDTATRIPYYGGGTSITTGLANLGTDQYFWRNPVTQATLNRAAPSGLGAASTTLYNDQSTIQFQVNDPSFGSSNMNAFSAGWFLSWGTAAGTTSRAFSVGNTGLLFTFTNPGPVYGNVKWPETHPPAGYVLTHPGPPILPVPANTAAQLYWSAPATGGGGTVTSVTGTANRITVTGTTSVTVDIASTYVGQTSITTLGTVTAGTWNGTRVAFPYIQTIATQSILGRYNAGIGDVEVLTPAKSVVITGSGFVQLDGDVTTPTNGYFYGMSAGVKGWYAPPSAVTSVAGTANRVTVTGTTSVTVDIASTYVGQTSITTLGTVTSGAWNATPVTFPYIQTIATQSILGRYNAGIGQIEVLTPAKSVTINGSGLVQLDGDVTTPTNGYFYGMSGGAKGWYPVTSGATSFLALTDAPHTYAGQALKRVRVNAAETALEFVDVSNDRERAIGCSFDGDGGVIAINTSSDAIRVPYNGTITGWTIVETSNPAATGSIEIGVWCDTYANYEPTVADAVFSTNPNLSSAKKNQSLAPAFVGAGATVVKGSFYKFVVLSCTGVYHCNVQLHVTLT